MTRGSDWIRQPPNARAWCKRVRNANELNLSLDGGFAITAPFLRFDQAVSLEPEHFLVIACQVSGSVDALGTAAGYMYVLVSGRLSEEAGDPNRDELALTPIAQTTMEEVFYDARVDGYVPTNKRNNSNPLYLMAVYMWMQFTANDPAARREQLFLIGHPAQPSQPQRDTRVEAIRRQQDERQREWARRRQLRPALPTLESLFEAVPVDDEDDENYISSRNKPPAVMPPALPLDDEFAEKLPTVPAHLLRKKKRRIDRDLTSDAPKPAPAAPAPKPVKVRNSDPPPSRPTKRKPPAQTGTTADDDEFPD